MAIHQQILPDYRQKMGVKFYCYLFPALEFGKSFFGHLFGFLLCPSHFFSQLNQSFGHFFHTNSGVSEASFLKTIFAVFLISTSIILCAKIFFVFHRHCAALADKNFFFHIIIFINFYTSILTQKKLSQNQIKKITSEDYSDCNDASKN